MRGTSKGYFQWLVKPGRLTLTILGIVGLSTFWNFYYAAPTVTPRYADPGNPFHYPFIISNDQWLMTFYNLRIDGGAEVPQSFQVKLGVVGPLETSWAGEQTTLAMPPTSHQDYWISVFAGQWTPNPALIQHAIVRLEIHYDIRILPRFYWHRTKAYGYRMLGAVSGSGGLWFPDDSVIDDPDVFPYSKNDLRPPLIKPPPSPMP
jgi:hypothetical protein